MTPTELEKINIIMEGLATLMGQRPNANTANDPIELWITALVGLAAYLLSRAPSDENRQAVITGAHEVLEFREQRGIGVRIEEGASSAVSRFLKALEEFEA